MVDNMRFPPRYLPGIIFLLLSALDSTAHGQAREQQGLNWRTFEVPDFGTSIQYPAGMFSPAGKPATGSGQRFERADGRAVLSIYSRQHPAGESPRTYLKRNLRMGRSTLDYARITRSFFAISSERDGVILYSRCNFSIRGGATIHCFDLSYPQDEKQAWDPIVTRISLSLRPLES
jgi:hypothetical protein